MDDTAIQNLRRNTDHGFWCTCALRAADFWDFIDKRQIDTHLMSWSTFYLTWRIVDWATHFVANHPEKPGIEVAAIIGAVMLTWSPVQAAVINWYFKARA